jgi:hypothetical protein
MTIVTPTVLSRSDSNAAGGAWVGADGRRAAGGGGGTKWPENSCLLVGGDLDLAAFVKFLSMPGSNRVDYTTI